MGNRGQIITYSCSHNFKSLTILKHSLLNWEEIDDTASVGGSGGGGGGGVVEQGFRGFRLYQCTVQ